MKPNCGCGWNADGVGARAAEPLVAHRRLDLLAGDAAARDPQHVDAAIGIGRVDDLAVRIGRRPVGRPRRAVGGDVVADLGDVGRRPVVEEADALLVPADGRDAVLGVEPVRRAVDRDRRLRVDGAAREHAVELGLPGALRRDRALAQARDVPGLELALPAAAAGRDLVGVDVVLLRDQQRLPAPLRVVEDEVVVRRRVAPGRAGRAEQLRRERVGGQLVARGAAAADVPERAGAVELGVVADVEVALRRRGLELAERPRRRRDHRSTTSTWSPPSTHACEQSGLTKLAMWPEPRPLPGQPERQDGDHHPGAVGSRC